MLGHSCGAALLRSSVEFQRRAFIMSGFQNTSSASAPSDQSADDQGLHGQRALLARLYREIGLAAVAAELDLHQYGPRVYQNPASLRPQPPARMKSADSAHTASVRPPAAAIRAA